ncbi:MAG TPA: twin-arginine translocation signal domain-containing protein [Candidatus Saccharimonadales bacterium]|nr:twin-arginine translocation signal domain-containing protein [Candidatus Saccharimonadales bacterium]
MVVKEKARDNEPRKVSRRRFIGMVGASAAAALVGTTLGAREARSQESNKDLGASIDQIGRGMIRAAPIFADIKAGLEKADMKKVESLEIAGGVKSLSMSGALSRKGDLLIGISVEMAYNNGAKTVADEESRYLHSHYGISNPGVMPQDDWAKGFKVYFDAPPFDTKKGRFVNARVNELFGPEVIGILADNLKRF